jgi:hypothetical protein
MDAITTISTAIVGALANLSKDAIQDSYKALKAALVKKVGKSSDLSKAVESLEKKPDSVGRQETLKEEIAAAQIEQDNEIVSLAKDLLHRLHGLNIFSQTAVIRQEQNAQNGIQIGSANGNVNIRQ